MDKFFGIGDITTDAFIKLMDAKVHCDINDKECRISMRFGDKIPFKDLEIVHGVGNAINASISAKKLGMKSFAVTNIGDDETGKNCLDNLKKNKVETKYVTKHKNKKTNYHFVLSYDAERTILIKHEKYNYKLNNFTEKPTCIYLSSIGEDLNFINKIGLYCKENNVKLIFQPGTFQLNTPHSKLKNVYKNTEIFACNKEEAEKILNTKAKIGTLLERMKKLGPNVVLITDGTKGAYAYDGKEKIFIPMYPDPKPPVERTGAGDSFTSAFSVFYLSGKNLRDSLMRAPINSMSVVQYVGAQKGLLTKNKIEEFLKKAPKNYKIKNI